MAWGGGALMGRGASGPGAGRLQTAEPDPSGPFWGKRGLQGALPRALSSPPAGFASPVKTHPAQKASLQVLNSGPLSSDTESPVLASPSQVKAERG